MPKVSKSVLYSLRSTTKNPLFSHGFVSTTTYTKTGKIDEIFIGKSVNTSDMARSAIYTLGKYYPRLVSASQIAVSRREIARIKHYREVDCSANKSRKVVYQMLSNKCSGMYIPRIIGVQLVCSISRLSCKISITASLSSFGL